MQTSTLTTEQKVQIAASAAGIKSGHDTGAMNATVSAAAGADNIRATDTADMNRKVFAAAGKEMHPTVQHQPQTRPGQKR